MCVNNLPKVALDSGAARIQTCNLLIASPSSYGYATEPQIIKINTSICQPKVIIKSRFYSTVLPCR